LFQNLAVWDAEGGRYQEYFQAYPVVRISFNDAKQLAWDEASAAIRGNISVEYERHAYLAQSDRISDTERAYVATIMEGRLSTDMGRSLLNLCRLLFKHHGRRAVVLIDEYDAPVMAGYTYGYYQEVVAFLKGWLTGALKDNNALAFAVLTGVQRITKESIFSDLNNLKVSTALNVVSDERYGFTDDEVDALAEYLDVPDDAGKARKWYDGYRFGGVDVYNPWSVLNFFDSGCVADVYWGNTSSNSVLGEMVRCADDRTWERLYTLMKPEGTVSESLDLGVVFPDAGIRSGALWSMLYLAGYLTTEDTELPNNTRRERPLRIPNAEIRELFRAEIVDRFSEVSGNGGRLVELHRALTEGEADVATEEFKGVLYESASCFDLTRENSYHMLVLGLLFGMRGYEDPISNREAGKGRFDVRVQPIDPDRRPVIVLELKYARPDTPKAENLDELARAALAQARDRVYGAGAHSGREGTLFWGVAVSGKNVACSCYADRCSSSPVLHD
ncbi:AAA family ATPase, partial [Adlercreutzia sp. ZJ138]|uniref:AAA family ATPase n=1 Tax=Adlercreutzia sp. ZJ138 TaxID=2709405 RepID=UPI0013ED1AA5